MGEFDSSDRFLKRALRLRNANESSNMKIVGPIIKLKSEQFKGESLNMEFREKAEKLAKIIGVLESKMKEAAAVNNGGAGGAVNDMKTEIKCLLLK